jgi:hypothetical protein
LTVQSSGAGHEPKRDAGSYLRKPTLGIGGNRDGPVAIPADSIDPTQITPSTTTPATMMKRLILIAIVPLAPSTIGRHRG